MQAPQIAAGLEAFRDRGAGTDAERRAALWLAAQLAQSGRAGALETFWCRPNWALAHAWHVGLAIAGSLVSVSSPRLGGALLLSAAACVVLDELTGISPGRRLTPERASQNVIARSSGGTSERLRLIVTANYDAGRAGLVYRDALRRPGATAQRVTRRLSLGWLGWLIVSIAWLEATAILRVDGNHGPAVGILQLPPTVGLVVALALLLELAGAGTSPGGGDNGTGVGVALALVRALDIARHANLRADIVLTGAGDAEGIGLRRYLRDHRADLAAQPTAVLGISPCTAGHVRWWRSDGRLWPLLYAVRLRRLAAAVATDAAYLHARSRDGRGATPALPARKARVPGLSIGCQDDRGLVPRSHQMGDTADAIDPAAADAAIQFGLLLVDAIDAALAADAAVPASVKPE